MTCGLVGVRCARICALVAAFSSIALIAGSCSAAPPEATTEKPSVAKLVEAALEAELDGRPEARAAYLAEALHADYDSPAARWQSGQVQINGEWRPIGNAEEFNSSNPLLAEYAELRLNVPRDIDGNITLANHITMASWCERAFLDGQAKYHWTKALELDPANEDALRGLNLYAFEGGYYSHEQISERKERVQQSQLEYADYAAQFERLLRDVVGPDSGAREAALQQLSEVRDVAALPALQDALITGKQPPRGPLSRVPSKQWDAMRATLAMALVSSLALMPEYPATVAILDSAVFADWQDVRDTAAKALRPRQATDYVPLLMGAMTLPAEVQSVLLPAGDGVQLAEVISREGGDTIAYENRLTSMRTVRLSRDPRRWRDLSTGYAMRLGAVANRTLMNVQQMNQQAAAVNARAQGALAVAAGGQNLGPNPRTWWDAWGQYNELHVGEKSEVQINQFNEIETMTMSCFVAGTPVWTEVGPVAIEDIRPGDVVLSQDPTTGQLTYQPVLKTTTRPPSRLVTLQAGEDSIVTTRGHRFWVDGMGWQMAKFLEPGMRLHAVDRGVVVDDVRPDAEEPAPAYNLVVADFHTYFVGASRMLVCDNSCPRPTLSAIPGMVRRRDRAATFSLEPESQARVHAAIPQGRPSVASTMMAH